MKVIYQLLSGGGCVVYGAYVRKRRYRLGALGPTPFKDVKWECTALPTNKRERTESRRRTLSADSAGETHDLDGALL